MAAATGTITVYEVPSGPGIRVDGAGWSGYESNPRYDSLLAKVIAWSPEAEPAVAIDRAARAVEELRIEGLTTNATLLAALVSTYAITYNDRIARARAGTAEGEDAIDGESRIASELKEEHKAEAAPDTVEDPNARKIDLSDYGFGP